MIVKLTYTVVARTKQQAVLRTKQHARRHAPRNPICIGRPSNRPIPCIGRQITSKLKDSREADDEHTASEQDSGDAERNRGSKEEVFTGINARGTIAGGLGRQSTQLEQEEDEILCVGWKKRNVIAGGRTRETAIDLTDDSFEFWYVSADIACYHTHYYLDIFFSLRTFWLFIVLYALCVY